MGNKGPDSGLIQEIMAKLLCRLPFPMTHQYRYQFIVLRHQCLIGIHVQHLDPVSIRPEQRLQGMQHVIAQMAVSAGIQGEFDLG